MILCVRDLVEISFTPLFVGGIDSSGTYRLLTT